jgi:hypothetical protein
MVNNKFEKFLNFFSPNILLLFTRSQTGFAQEPEAKLSQFQKFFTLNIVLYGIQIN